MKTLGNLNAYFGVATARFERAVHHENFRQLPVLNASVLITDTDPTLAQMAVRFRANRDWEIAGTNAVDGSAAFADGGGVKLTTAGASGDQVILRPQQDTNQTALAAIKLNTSDESAMLVSVKTGASVADVTLWAGLKLTDTGVRATDNDQAYFRYNAAEAEGKWQAVVSRGGVDQAAIALGEEAVLASSAYVLCVAMDRERRALFYVNGELLYTAPALAADVDLKVSVGVQAGAVATKSVTVRDVAVSKVHND
jgi:hypothetical protein